MIGVGKMKQYSNVLDKPLSKGKQEVSLSAFAFLFSELVQYNQTQVDNIAELERRLEDAGYAVGARVLELLCHRDKGNRRETRLLGILSFVHSTVWKVLFGKVADSLEKGTEHEDEYMISEKELLVNRFISIPKDMGTFNCGAFVAGIVRGVLDGAGFPAVVTAHFVPVEGQQRPRTTILIKFAEEVLRREARLYQNQRVIVFPRKSSYSSSERLGCGKERSNQCKGREKERRMNKGGGAASGGGLGGGGSGPTAAAAAAAAQKQKALLQRVETDIANIVDNFSSLVNVSRVNDPPVRNSQEAFMMEMRAARMVQAADSLLKLVSELKQTAIFSGFASLNDHVEQRIVEFNQQAEKTDQMLARIGEEAAASLKELESHYYSSALRTSENLQP
ncbi:trafficking protein particle complex subunit 5 [Prunus yedoensis var. nudiflora]|uniref:Trafficking protein particle complex subunit 5 n=4 Tax=Prunus TaxID=3754 RepID=A0A314UX92_PRUYE|nr:trafficking protein particle complex subunit 5 [Prunus yedoensis var. nudiflora]